MRDRRLRAAGLPCALDTETVRNLAFYRQRGYQVVAELEVPGSDLTISTMRRDRATRATVRGPSGP